MKTKDLTEYLNKYLDINNFNDYGPNGLQVYGYDKIGKIVTGVSASVDLFQKAISENAHAIIVHHGIIWNSANPIFKGSYKKRVKLLLENNLNLYAYHLPLDAHKIVGNNIQIANILGLKNTDFFAEMKGVKIGIRGSINNISSKKLFKEIKFKINQKTLIFPFGPDIIKKVGIVTGGGQKEIYSAINNDLDLFITGEVSEFVYHLAKEENIHFIAAGHYATEKFGIIALGNHIKEKFKLDVKFIDIPNPV